MKNYYGILEVNRKTTPEDIKIAYRALAKKYHPDNNKGKSDAEEMFKDVNEAYSCLNNPDEKRKYDRKSLKFKYGIETTGPLSDVTYEVNKGKNAINDLFSSFFGKIKDPKKTNNILNKGVEINTPIKGENEETEIQITLEEAYFGGDKKVVIKGVEGETRTLTINIPKGIQDTHKVRLAGCGKLGKNGGKSGDLIITIRLSKHKELEVEGLNIIKKVYITPAQAILGCNLDIDSIDGSINVRIPAGTQTDKEIKVANRGFVKENKEKGDFKAIVKIKIPKDLTKEQ